MDYKEKLYNYCYTLLRLRVEQAQQAMDAAQKNANAETKSSAGDKYETGRAMAHLDKEMHTKRHAIALHDLYKLEALEVLERAETVSFGSLVKTNIGTYFIAVGLGKIQLGEQEYRVVSPESPIGQILLGLEEDAQLDFRGKKLVILSIQ